MLTLAATAALELLLGEITVIINRMIIPRYCSIFQTIGRSFGESGLYLHGMPYVLAPDYQKRVPLLFWTSPGFEQEKSLDLSCLRSIAKKRETHSHDNIFHSLLGIMDIETQAYDPNLDVFHSCRRLG